MLTTLILAAGNSQRFRDLYGDAYPPKQFVKFPLRRRSPGQMWENAVSSLTIRHKLYMAMQDRHVNWLDPKFRRDTHYLWLLPTRGQADTLLQALRRIPCPGELLVVNCDNGFGHGVLNRLVHEGRYRRQIAALTMEKPSAAPGNVNRWSFVDGHPTFHHAAEKRMLSPFALAGAYYFPSAEEAMYAAERTVDNAYEIAEFSLMSNGTIEPGFRYREPYVSEMFKWLPEQKLSVDIDSDDFYDWGTPDALQNYVAHEVKR